MRNIIFMCYNNTHFLHCLFTSFRSSRRFVSFIAAAAAHQTREKSHPQNERNTHAACKMCVHTHSHTYSSLFLWVCLNDVMSMPMHSAAAGAGEIAPLTSTPWALCHVKPWKFYVQMRVECVAILEIGFILTSVHIPWSRAFLHECMCAHIECS